MHLGSEKFLHGTCLLAFVIVDTEYFFVVVFQGYINSESPQAAVSLLDEMLCLGLEPDRLTYNTLIHACIKCGDMVAAMKFLKEMKVTRLYLKGQFKLTPSVTQSSTGVLLGSC